MSNKTKFIINTSVEYFGATAATGFEHDEQMATVLEFLENEELTIIAAVHNKNDGVVQFHHRIPNDEISLLFYKIPQVKGQRKFLGPHAEAGAAATSANNQPLGILTLEGGLVKSIYNSVSRVFSPQVEASKKSEYNSELSGLLENLHVSLGSTLGLPQTGIASIRDEIKYWRQKLNQKSSSRIDREMSQMFIGVLENIEKQMSLIANDNTNSTIEEFLDNAHNNLDALWRLPYQFPQNRMTDVLEIIGNYLLQACEEQLLAEDIWNLSSYFVNNLMSQSIDTVDSWMQLCDSLTRLFWPNYVQHPWVGDAYIPKRGQLFKERLAEIRNIKNLYKQIATLLGDDEVGNMFYTHSPFKDINTFDTSSLGQTKWNKALHHFEQLLQPIDERIAAALKGQLHNHLSNPRQVIFIFSKFETLIQRPTVLELLTIEREQFLQSLQILLQDLRKAMTDTNMEPDAGHLSVICNECRWLKIVQYQIQEIEKVSHLVSGREGFDKINKAMHEIKEETESLLRTNFEIWCGQCSTAVKSGELKLRDDQPVVKFEKEGRQLMRVTFNPKLVTFCQDVREFENLGYNVPSEIRASATHASQFICYARRLQQIATFHNTIGDRMIPCQRPIMLKNAMELSKLVQSETVAWNDEESVQRYVNMLQTAVSKLSADNTLLVGYHEQAKKTVIKLMNTDLFTQNQVWKDEMRHLRELVTTLERQGFTNLDAFKVHWDHQLYKVLEYQYIIGLVDMNNKLPDIHVDLVFRQRRLCYRPPEEEIRDKYFTQLRRFIERPCSFRGLSDNSNELFKTMVEINRPYFGPLFEKADQLFKKLQQFKQLWLPWVALGCVDVEELCGIHLNLPEDWDRNFRTCKNFSQRIAKLQNTEESIDCIVINMLPLRSDIEFISRRYWEVLSNSLRASILNDVSLIQEFLHTSLQFLQNVPMDELSITESGMKYEKMMTELPKISETLTLVKGKDTCLAGWCKERVSALAGILLQWNKLQPLIENHSVILQRQVDMIRAQAQSQIQNIHNEAEKFFLRWESTIAELEANEDATLEVFKERQAHWQQIQAKKAQLLEECQKVNLEFPAAVLAPFSEIESKMQSQSQQWEVYDNYLTEMEAILAEEWAIYRRRPYVLNEFIAKWEVSVNSSIDLPAKRIRQSVERLQSALPVLQQLQSDALNERHWATIFMALKNRELKPMHSITLKDILADHSALQAASSEITNIVKQASSEQVVRQAIAELDQWSVTATLKLINHRDSNGSTVTLIKDYQEVLNKIGDNQSLLQSAKNSAAFDAFSDQAALWESRLNSLDVLLTSLSQSQRRWVYLEPVFSAGTLKNEEALFKRIDKDFRYIMREIQSDSRVISLTKINNITTIVNSLETQLSRCQNNLMSYIMEKRNSFPRFYFLGDDDLLEIMGQASKDAAIIQKHINKLFPGCHSLGLKEVTAAERIVYVIQAVHSAEGDVLLLKRTVEMTGPIETWLNSLVVAIQLTLKEQIVECYKQTTDKFEEKTIKTFPIQVLAMTRAVHFTKQAEKCIVSMSLQKLLQNLNSEITQYSALKHKNRDNLMQRKLRALLLDLVHYKTVVEELLRHNVMHTSDWHWLSQLKFYLGDGQKDHQLLVRMVYAEFEYSYEFLGNPNKLVSTSLTQKCFLLLTQAMHMGLGGNPFGPAGTGKTECVKALGALLGRLVLVFNCDENVDTESMALILTGLARCGAWGCFDEFNRLQEATLSTISMLIQPIQSALKDKSASVQIGEKQVQLNQNCGIFVTLNPAGAEYGGRQKLPGNIQALFRPIVMQQPEPLEISRVMLFVEGFHQADEIADRIVELFDLCTHMLSQQRHYDWGLRELKTILLACGEGLQQLVQHPATEENHDTDPEMSIVVRCIRSSTMSKLTLQDVTRFDMLLQNVFPEIEVGDISASPLQQALTRAFDALGLCVNNMQVEKALQLHEQLTKRMGVVVVGPPGCGKSTIITLLKQALTMLGSATIRVHIFNPKAMSRLQLLGHLDADTRQWIDGVLTNTAVTVNAEGSHVHSWIVCDGSIDPEWIEALNSVLDDNRLLTLPSGWRIQFGNNVNFIFETDDVRHASPATISRMGIVNMSHEDFPQQPILANKLANEEYGDLLQSFIEHNFIPAAVWVETEYLYSMPALNRNSLLGALLLQIKRAQSREEFCLAVCRALFGYLPNERHNELANMVYEKANIYIPNPTQAELMHFNSQLGALALYEPDTDHYQAESELNVHLIQTAAVKSYLGILRAYLDTPKYPPFLILGPNGSAKTLLLQHAVQDYSGYELVMVNCSTQLSAAYIAHCLKQHCVAVSGPRGREFKPKQTHLILYMKNLDLCHLDAWGSSEIVELLLQLVQRGGFYADNLEWINVSGLQICASISQKFNNNTSLLKIAPRFLAVNQFLRVSYPSDKDMLSIVQSRLEPMLLNGRFKGAAVNLQYLVEGLMECFNKIQETFTPTSQGTTHYQFSPKFIMKLLEGLKYYPENAFNEALYAELTSMFRDRLVSEEDVEKFDAIIRQTLRKLSGKEKIYFVPKTAKHNAALHALQHDEWMDEVQKQIHICNAESLLIEAPITKELLDQAAKAARILARAEHHLLLVGPAGGRQLDALYIAAKMQNSKLYAVQGGRDYGLLDFYNDIKMAMQTAALDNQCTCLVIDHCWLSFVRDLLKPIEAILEGSDILDLFGDDLESIANALKHSAQLEGYQESIGTYFMKRARQNLHLIILLDSTDHRTYEYFNKIPALYNNMDLLYVRPASNETQAMLPKKYIEMLVEASSSKEKVPISSYFVDVLENLVAQQAPQRYYQMIRSYYYVYCNFAHDISKTLDKLQQGVDKLSAAHAVVDTLKSNAVHQEDALADKRKLAKDALEMISATMRNANEQKTNMLDLKKKAQVSSEILKERQKEIQQELSEVEPILAEASAAVGQIKSEALSEIRSLRAPPEAIRDILEGVLRLMGIRDTSWNSMKTFLAKRGVKEDIRSLDPARINPENCDAVEKLLVAKADSFEMKNAKRASVAAAPLAAWVKASVRYSKVIQSIKPLEREQHELQQNLNVAENEMQSLMTGLDDVDNRVKQLSVKLNDYTQEAAVLELKLDEARNTLKAAEILVKKLGAEFHTWNRQLNEYKLAHKTLDTKTLLIALAINYFSHMTLEERHALKDLFMDFPTSQTTDITKNLLTEQEQIIWESMGLARDAQIIENAALLKQMLELPFGSYPIPLVLDPTQTAKTWLEEYLRTKAKPYEIITQNNERLAYTLELAVRFGKILIIEDCQDLRPPLMQMVSARVFVKFNKRQVEVGSKLVDLHENFQLVLVTKTNKLSMGAECLAYMTCVQFTVTAMGLTDQLISKAIVLQKPELEQRRIELLKNEGVLLKKRIELEDKLLEELSAAEGDILKNDKLLQTLNEVKESSSFIDNSLKESAMVKETLIAEYNQLRGLCTKAAQFYMGLTALYEISALVFIKLFLQTLESMESSSLQNEQQIYDNVVRATFQYLARSTARASHLSLALYTCRKAYPLRIKSMEWEMFVTNFMSTADASVGSAVSLRDRNLPDFMNKEQQLKLQILITEATELEQQLQLNKEGEWRSFIENQQERIPGDISNSFHRMLITQIFRPDLMATQLRLIATEILGVSPEAIVQPTVEQLVEESTSERPILVITQTENDPATEIRNVAAKRIGKDKYQELSIGKGNERRALDQVRLAAETGKWICIKNVHLVPTWLLELERELDVMKKSDSFRLWLICESTVGFSEAIMYKFVKVLYEFPSGIKQKVRRMVQNYAAAEQRPPNNDAKLVKMRIVMFIATAVLQERRKFIPQGWSKYYEFGESDLKAALGVLLWLDATTASGRCDWKIMQSLCEHVAFGGRINNSRDLQVLQRYLLEFCNNEVLSTRWTPLNLKVNIPTTTHMQDFLNAIAKFPDMDEPETFKLSKHSNISREIDFARSIVKELRSSYYKLEVLNNADQGHKENKLEKQVKPILSLWRKLGGKCTVAQTSKELDNSTLPNNPWAVFVLAELTFAIKCFNEIHKTLSQAHNLLKENEGCFKDESTENILRTLAENQVPLNWKKLWSGPQAAVDYLKGFIIRAEAAEKRYRSDLNGDFTRRIDFKTIFNCQNFLCCLKLVNANKLRKSSKNLTLHSSVATADQESGNSAEANDLVVVTIAPLQVDGAIYNDKLMVSTQVESPSKILDKTAEFQITFKEFSKDQQAKRISKSYSTTDTVSLPLYANVSREKVICHLDLPTSDSAETVLLSGAALIVADF